MPLRATLDLVCEFCGHRWTSWNAGSTDEPQFPDAEACSECGGVAVTTAIVVRDTRTASL